MARSKRTTKEKLLDAAEKLFARQGFHGTSLRAITGEAGVDLALVNYHFGGKKPLFAAVLERRGAVLNEERLRRLAEVRQAAAPRPASTEAVVGAFFDPILDFLAHAGPGWHSYFSLLAWVNNSPEWGRRLMSKTFDATVSEFIRALMESLPERRPRGRLLGLQLPHRRAHSLARRDRPPRCPLRRPLPLDRCRRAARAPRPVRGGGAARAGAAPAGVAAAARAPVAAGRPRVTVGRFRTLTLRALMGASRAGNSTSQVPRVDSHTAKRDAIDAIERQPEEVAVDEIVHRFHLLNKVCQGLQDIEAACRLANGSTVFSRPDRGSQHSRVPAPSFAAAQRRSLRRTSLASWKGLTAKQARTLAGASGPLHVCTARGGYWMTVITTEPSLPLSVQAPPAPGPFAGATE